MPWIHHAITTGDILIALGICTGLAIAFVGFAILAVNMGWDR